MSDSIGSDKNTYNTYNKNSNNMNQGYGKKGAIIHSSWEYKIVLFWWTVWGSVKTKYVLTMLKF